MPAISPFSGSTARRPGTSLLARHPAAFYFVLTYLLSWSGASLVAASWLLHGQPVPKFAGLMMFPVMLLGPMFTSLGLTWWLHGAEGLRTLGSRMIRLRVGARWYAALLLPPLLVLGVLFLLRTLVAPVFAPNFFWIGATFGLVAGFAEEIGWTGFALPSLLQKRPAFRVSLLLGVLWGLWHTPVVDYLGAATPHRRWWLPFLLAFIAAMAAIRVFIAWLYVNTQSVLLAQLMHASSTAALVVFGAPSVTPGQETLWYAVYAAALWLLVILLRLRTGPSLRCA